MSYCFEFNLTARRNPGNTKERTRSIYLGGMSSSNPSVACTDNTVPDRVPSKDNTSQGPGDRPAMGAQSTADCQTSRERRSVENGRMRTS